MKNDITNRDDISTLVRTFYSKIRMDAELGPIFNAVITNWEQHLELLTTFWHMSLFGGRDYKGDPFKAHQKVDNSTNNIITANHFGAWLNLWFATIDELFEGDNAKTLKRRARKMQTPLMIAIFENREKKYK